MLNLLNVSQPVMVNGVVYQDSAMALKALENFDGDVEIRLNVKAPVAPTAPVAQPAKQEKPSNVWYRIEVRKYMTLPSMPGFDFMAKWNNDNPMPSRVMVMQVIEETKGMYRVSGHLKPEPSTKCLHCGRTLTNPVSFNYGIGPICGGHMNIAPPKTVEEFKARKAEIQKTLADIKWEGYIPKSAIISMEEVANGAEVEAV